MCGENFHGFYRFLLMANAKGVSASDIITFKVNNNYYKQQINTSRWEIPGKVPNTLQLNIVYIN